MSFKPENIRLFYRVPIWSIILILWFCTFAIYGVLARTTLAASVKSGTTSQADKPEPVSPEDYGKWEQIRSGILSPFGKWLAYEVRRVNEENEIRVRNLKTDSLIVIPYGTNAAFSVDGQWLAYAISHSETERKQLEKKKKPVQNKAGIRNLKTGHKTVVEGIESFAFSDDSKYLAMKRYPVKEKKSKGVDVILRNLSSSIDVNFGNVSEFAWQEKGGLLAMIIDAEGQIGNSVQVFDPATGRLRTLDADSARYVGLIWREKNDDLTALRVEKDDVYEDSTHVLLAWKNLAGRIEKRIFDPGKANGFPSDTRIVSSRNLQWSDDGETIFFGIKDWQKKPVKADTTEADSTNIKNGNDVEKSNSKDDEPAGVEIWHSKDVKVIPEQKLRANRERAKNFLAAWHLAANRFVRLGDNLTEEVMLFDGQKHAVGIDETPYEFEGMFGRMHRDLYLIDVKSGDKTKIRERIRYRFDLSPGGRYILYLEKDHYFTYDVKSRKHTNLTAKLPTSFVNTEYDHPVEQKPPFGVAGWLKGDKAVLVYDKYDIWQIRPDGASAVKLTNGAAHNTRYRYVHLDKEEEFIDPAKPIYLRTYGEWSKKYGYSRLQLNKKLQLENLVWLDKDVGRLIKAEKASVFAYLVQDFDDSPDYFVSGQDFSKARQVSQTNPFQKDYAWGRSELLEYENTRGRKLQAALYYPANYEPGKKYPMIVYIYEIRSPSVHRYVVPSERRAYNTTVFTSEGYFVLQPDIVFENRNPGPSSVSTIEAAVSKVLQTGMVDSEQVGLMGHSWGGYQTAFAVTQTDIFAAAVAGAPLTNFFSMYGSIFWNTGIPETGHFEVGQERMDLPYWEDVDAYIKSSPVFGVANLNTPLLVEFGDKDGSVDWHQGIEYYNVARRAGKNLVMLVYAGENHGLRKKPNQIDYHRRIKQWFGHYLKGEPAPEWITEGVPYLEQEKALKKGGK